MNGDKKCAKEKAKVPGVGRGSPSWLSRDEKPKLRRPNNTTVNQSARESEFSSSNVAQPELTKISGGKKLSANAAPFFPKNITSIMNLESSPTGFPQKHSVQGRINQAREMPPCINFPSGESILDHSQDISQPRNNDIQDAQMCSYMNYNSISKNEYGENYGSYYREQGAPLDKEDLGQTFEIFQHFEKIIIAVTSNPGDFDHLFPQFISNFRREGNLKCLEMLVTILIGWSITESNFRYSGARFCTYFDTTSGPDEKSFFREALYYTCNQEIQEQQPSEDNFDQRKCYGLILFLAELVAQMDDSFASSISELLLEFIIKVLKKPTSDITKCICQAFKLVGPKLEKDQSKVAKVENVMQLLSELVIGKKVNKQVGNMVYNVHALRNSNWGMSNSDSCGMNTAPLQQVQQTSDEPGTSDHLSRTNVTLSKPEHQSPDEPLVYGPDGQIILSAEESKFLEDHLKHDDEESEQPYEDDNFDDEIATAYEEFLRDNSK